MYIHVNIQAVVSYLQGNTLRKNEKGTKFELVVIGYRRNIEHTALQVIQEKGRELRQAKIQKLPLWKERKKKALGNRVEEMIERVCEVYAKNVDREPEKEGKEQIFRA